MAGKVGQAVGGAASKANASANSAAGAGAKSGKESALNKGAKRDPELYVCRKDGSGMGKYG